MQGWIVHPAADRVWFKCIRRRWARLWPYNLLVWIRFTKTTMRNANAMPKRDPHCPVVVVVLAIYSRDPWTLHPSQASPGTECLALRWSTPVRFMVSSYLPCADHAGDIVLHWPSWTTDLRGGGGGQRGGQVSLAGDFNMHMGTLIEAKTPPTSRGYCWSNRERELSEYGMATQAGCMVSTKVPLPPLLPAASGKEKL